MDDGRWTLEEYFGAKARTLRNVLARRMRLHLEHCLRLGTGADYGLVAAAGETLRFPEEAMTFDDVQAGLRLAKPMPSAPLQYPSTARLLIELRLTVTVEHVREDETAAVETLPFRVWFDGDLQLGVDQFFISVLVRENDHAALAEYRAALAKVRRVSVGPGLVPLLDGDNMDDAAAWMLEMYLPDLLDRPRRLDPHLLAERLNVRFLPQRIARDEHVTGKTYFAPSQTNLYSDTRGSYSQRNVGKTTLLIDPTAAYNQGIGVYDETLVHECIHRILHRQAVLLKDHVEDAENVADPQVQAMEAQTGALVPRLQMPLAPFREKARELLTAYGPFYESWRPERVDVLPLVIDDLAGFFNVSRTAAKLRLIDAGYPDARGAYVHIDGRDLPPHSWTPGALAPGDTFSIPAADAARLLLEDEDFARAAQGYIYLDGHFVLNHPAYVTRSRHDDSWQLTDTARHHMDTCCLVFTLHDADSAPTPRYEHRCLLSQSAEMATVLGYLPHSAPELSQKKLEDMREEAAKTRRMLRNMPGGFTEAFQYALKECGVSQAKLAARTGRSQDTISLNIRQESRAPMEFMVKMCLAANLPPKISEELMKKGGYYLDPDDPLHQIYEVLLTFFYSRPYPENEQFLLEQQRILESA